MTTTKAKQTTTATKAEPSLIDWKGAHAFESSDPRDRRRETWGEESRLLTLIRSTNDRQGNGGKQNKRPKAKSCKWSHFKYRNASIEGNRCRSAARKKTVLKTPTTTAVEKYQKIWNHSLRYLMRGNCCRPRHLISWEQIRCDGRLLEPTTSWTEIDPTC